MCREGHFHIIWMKNASPSVQSIRDPEHWAQRTTCSLHHTSELKDELCLPRAGEAVSPTALNQSVIMQLLQKIGQAPCSWVLLCGMVENLSLAMHVQLSALSERVNAPKAISMWYRKHISGIEIPRSGMIDPAIFPFPVVWGNCIPDLALVWERAKMHLISFLPSLWAECRGLVLRVSTCSLWFDALLSLASKPGLGRRAWTQMWALVTSGMLEVPMHTYFCFSGHTRKLEQAAASCCSSDNVLWINSSAPPCHFLWDPLQLQSWCQEGN